MGGSFLSADNFGICFFLYCSVWKAGAGERKENFRVLPVGIRAVAGMSGLAGMAV